MTAEVASSVGSLAGPPYNLRDELQQLVRYWQEHRGRYANTKLQRTDERVGFGFSEQLSYSQRQRFDARLLQALAGDEEVGQYIGVGTRPSTVCETPEQTEAKASAVIAAAAALDTRAKVGSAEPGAADDAAFAAARLVARLGV